MIQDKSEAEAKTKKISQKELRKDHCNEDFLVVELL